MELDFAITEFHLYLDTHANDTVIASKLEDYITKCKALKREYESKYGPISANSVDSNRWSWIKDPWPWDCQNMNSQNTNNALSEGGIL